MFTISKNYKLFPLGENKIFRYLPSFCIPYLIECNAVSQGQFRTYEIFFARDFFSFLGFRTSRLLKLVIMRLKVSHNYLSRFVMRRLLCWTLYFNAILKQFLTSSWPGVSNFPMIYFLITNMSCLNLYHNV